MKKSIVSILAFTSAVSLPALFFGSCAGMREQGRPVTVISREEGSGTRGAFVELFKVLDKNNQDAIAPSAEITNNTAVMLNSVAGDKNAIGYVSLGSLNNTVKALNIDGAEASAAAIRGGAYKIFRPFLIAVKGEVSPATEEFISFILSAGGQEVVARSGYLPLEGSAERGGQDRVLSGAAGKVIIAGSSSVSPLMEKLVEAYIKNYPAAEIEIQQSDSSTGINAVISGICDIGMTSRELKPGELEKGVRDVIIATDGIAVIVNHENSIDGLTHEQVRTVFSGAINDWEEIK